ncbi:MAG: type IV pilin protein [Luteimonas sp.]
MGIYLKKQHRRFVEPRSRVAGFTLIELMIVVAVVAILAAIALPSYQDAIRKGRRGQAKADMVEIAQMYERFRTVNNSYDAYVLPFAQSPRTGTAHYLIASVDNASTFTLTATPQGGQANDARCMVLTVNQAGTKTKSGTGTLQECW